MNRPPPADFATGRNAASGSASTLTDFAAVTGLIGSGSGSGASRNGLPAGTGPAAPAPSFFGRGASGAVFGTDSPDGHGSGSGSAGMFAGSTGIRWTLVSPGSTATSSLADG